VERDSINLLDDIRQRPNSLNLGGELKLRKILHQGTLEKSLPECIFPPFLFLSSLVYKLTKISIKHFILKIFVNCNPIFCEKIFHFHSNIMNNFSVTSVINPCPLRLTGIEEEEKECRQQFPLDDGAHIFD